MLRVVLDTNVFVSSLLVKAGQPAQILAAWREQRFLLVVSSAIIAEIRSTLNYPRIRRKYRISDQAVDHLVALLEHEALVVPGRADTAGMVPDDPADERILACAIDSQADLIVSGDRHLLSLEVCRGIPVLTVHEFLERLQAEAAA